MCVITFPLWLTIHPKCVFKLRKEALYFMHEITTITAANIQNMKWFGSMVYKYGESSTKTAPPSKRSISGGKTLVCNH